VDWGDKNYGNGSSRRFTVMSHVPDGTDGVPISSSDEIMQDGVEMYLTAWQTALQTRYANGDIDSNEYKRQTASFLVRIRAIQGLYQKIKGHTTEELQAFLRKFESNETSNPS